MPIYHGACHCGAVQFQIEAEINDLYTCDCSLCAKKNALMTTVPERHFSLTSGEDKLSLYQWNTKVARHYFCSVCGIYPFHRKRAMPDHYGINVRCLENFDPSPMPIRRADGRTMTLVEQNPAGGWSGPRT